MNRWYLLEDNHKEERLDGACYSREEKTCPSERVDMFVSM
uniref:Uncharacterized protein n=1 Tax=Peronospora matthiolae TaxID=2874970 RepID=A0AAV1T3J7_9STRA